MSVDFNIVVFGGRLVSDPTTLGGKGAKFEVASNRSYKSGEEVKRETTFMPVFCWGKLGDQVLKNCKKGDGVLVEGKLEDRRFTGDDGQKRKMVCIKASDVRFVGGKKDFVVEEDKSEMGSDVPSETRDAINRLLGSK